MDDKYHPQAQNLPSVWYARAGASGLWMRRQADGSLACAKDFSRAIACPSKAEALILWSTLCAAAMLGSRPPAWASKPPVLFPGPDPTAPPAGLSVFLALCQGRFVAKKETYTGFEWNLTPNMAEAHIFASPDAAKDALRTAMPWHAEGAPIPESCVLPLRGLFGAPIVAHGCNVDPLAHAMSRAGALAELGSEDLPASAPRPRPKTL